MSPASPIGREFIATGRRGLAVARERLAASQLRTNFPAVADRQSVDRALASTKAVR